MVECYSGSFVGESAAEYLFQAACGCLDELRGEVGWIGEVDGCSAGVLFLLGVEAVCAKEYGYFFCK